MAGLFSRERQRLFAIGLGSSVSIARNNRAWSCFMLDYVSVCFIRVPAIGLCVALMRLRIAAIWLYLKPGGLLHSLLQLYVSRLRHSIFGSLQSGFI